MSYKKMKKAFLEGKGKPIEEEVEKVVVPKASKKKTYVKPEVTTKEKPMKTAKPKTASKKTAKKTAPKKAAAKTKKTSKKK